MDYDNVWCSKSTLPPELRIAAIVEKQGLNWQQALEYAVKHRKVKAKEVKHLNFHKPENRVRQLRYGLIFAGSFSTNESKYRTLIAEQCMY